MKTSLPLSLALLLSVAMQADAASHFKARFIEQYDGNGDGVLDSVEFEQSRRDRFDSTDVDNNGTVDADEYLLEWENHLDTQLQRDRAGQVSQTGVRFKSVDEDDNGTITEAEFKASGERAFAHVDSNSDGVIDAMDMEAAEAAEKARLAGMSREDALARVRQVLHMPSTHSPGGMLTLYDSNGDEQVTGEEYTRLRQAQYARTDLNSDGGIDADEYLREFEDRIDAEIAADRKGQVKQTGVRFKALDKDENGAMTFAEYQYSGHRSFKRWDTDADGVVTWEEADPAPREEAPAPAAAVAANAQAKAQVRP
ncbi:calcium-binding protein [Parahaliea mediterranea]|uniref:calcium-binding protein n=1 Tax=Parahaliea mediterranea TaxID=651086 RepID=UPI000E2FCBB0|nr:calcium-binding protein [Parahaliea mediterranea]